MTNFNSISFFSDGSEESLEIARKISSEARSMGWNIVLEGCGDVLLVIGDGGQYPPTQGYCEDVSEIWRVQDITWTLRELNRLIRTY